MRHLPEICISICGAVGLVSVVVLPWVVRLVRRAPEYVTLWPRGEEAG
jgi:hypothetical protein